MNPNLPNIRELQRTVSYGIIKFKETIRQDKYIQNFFETKIKDPLCTNKIEINKKQLIFLDFQQLW